MAADATADPLKEQMRTGAVEREFYRAGQLARQYAHDDGLDPEVRPFGEHRYSLAQGLKASVHGREDITAILLIQQLLLRRLQGLRVLSWIGIALLAYIAYRLS